MAATDDASRPVENHGNMPLQIVELQVGENSCWSSTGFVADGCAALPVTLAPLQAWDIHVSYYSDCMSINELQSMRVVTTVGHFDAILQAISASKDMEYCEQARFLTLQSPFLEATRYLVILLGLVTPPLR